MKLTETKLRKIVREELSKLNERQPNGSAQEAVQDVVGEDEAASMINYAANISGDSFLNDMQDALKDIKRALKKKQS